MISRALTNGSSFQWELLELSSTTACHFKKNVVKVMLCPVSEGNDNSFSFGKDSPEPSH